MRTIGLVMYFALKIHKFDFNNATSHWSIFIRNYKKNQSLKADNHKIQKINMQVSQSWLSNFKVYHGQQQQEVLVWKL